MVVKALSDCKTYFTNLARPNTVAAGWTAVVQNQPLNIAFGTTCIGDKEEKAKMAEARCEFMKILTDTLKNESKKVNNRALPPNVAGNCPEFLVWPVVCNQVGSYKSLCFNMSQEIAYRCCTHCETTLEKLGANNIQIDDLWQTALLGTGVISNAGAYPWRKLKERDQILIEYGKLTNL
jgi:hypothetical protein